MTGRVVVEWGDTDKVTDSHSVRKSILSVLVGIATRQGLMDLDLTLDGLVRAFYSMFGQRVNNEQFLALTRLILEACPQHTGDCPEV